MSSICPSDIKKSCLKRISGSPNVEDCAEQAPITTHGSVLPCLSPLSDGLDILEDEKTIHDYIDSKIKEHGSMGNEEPFHVLNLDSVLKRQQRWISNLPRVKPFYAVKCNSTPVIVKMLSALGTGFDCASKAEIQLALSLGATPDQIIYAHTTKPLSHIRYACTRGVDTMTFDNEDELLKISLCHAKAKLVLRIAVDDSKSIVRLNSKFGASLASVGKLLERAKELSLQVIGVSFHVGSGCTGGEAFKQAIADARVVFDMANSMGFPMSLLDIGGGFSWVEEYRVKFEELSDAINESLDKLFPPDSGVEIIAEPGRYFVESAFTLAVNVIGKRIITDEHSSGEANTLKRKMMYYINDGVYGSLACLTVDPVIAKLKPYLHRGVESSEPRYQSVLWGPTCHCLDKVIENYLFPELYVGDWLLFDNIGAYSICVSTDFNGFEKAHLYPVVTATTLDVLMRCDSG